MVFNDKVLLLYVVLYLQALFSRCQEFCQEVIHIFLLRYETFSFPISLSCFFLTQHYLNQLFDSEHLISDTYAAWHKVYDHSPRILHFEIFFVNPIRRCLKVDIFNVFHWSCTSFVIYYVSSNSVVEYI